MMKCLLSRIRQSAPEALEINARFLDTGAADQCGLMKGWVMPAIDPALFETNATEWPPHAWRAIVERR